MPTWMLLLVVFSISANAAPIYRCSDPDGDVTFSDRSCPGLGEELTGASIEPSVYDYEPPPEMDVDEPVKARASRRKGPVVCNNAADLRHLDLLIDSAATDDKQRRFLRMERRRVESCKLDRLEPHERNLRDAALSRTGSLRDSERIAAQREIEDLYAQHGVGFQSEYRRHAGESSRSRRAARKH